MIKKSQLGLSVATAALVTGLATSANAGCAVDQSNVTCSNDSTVAEVNAAMASVGGSDVNLTFETGSSTVRPGNDLMPTQAGAIVIENAGDVGVEAAPVGVF